MCRTSQNHVLPLTLTVIKKYTHFSITKQYSQYLDIFNIYFTDPDHTVNVLHQRKASHSAGSQKSEKL